MSNTDSRQLERRRDELRKADILEQLRDLYVAERPDGYDIQKSVDAFYSSGEFWEKFQEWMARCPDLYPASDTAFVESAIDVDGARIINIGTFYPWAEIEWGGRAASWVGLDCNPIVLERASQALRAYPDHRVTLVQGDITAPMDLGERFDCVLDLSTLDQLDPRSYGTILENYARLSDRLVLAYDATTEPLAVYDFDQCGFNALINPDVMEALLKHVGYSIIEHRPFAHKPYRSYVAATRQPECER